MNEGETIMYYLLTSSDKLEGIKFRGSLAAAKRAATAEFSGRDINAIISVIRDYDGAVDASKINGEKWVKGNCLGNGDN